MTEPLTPVFLAVGSNVGDRHAHLRRAARLLHGAVQDMRTSTLYETPALLPEDAPADWNKPFLNGCITGFTALGAEQMLALCKRIEQQIGRVQRGVWGPREIDIDVLAFGDQQLKTEKLTLPHPRMLERDFVLVPLAEVAGDWRYPAGEFCGQDIAQIARSKGMSATTMRPCGKLKSTPQLMGILNLTPDSFSDGGKLTGVDDAVQAALRLVEQGADVLDIGAESTRPGARILTAEEEWQRLTAPLEAIVPVLKGRVKICIDTYHAETAKRALSLGVDWINDVSGLRDDQMMQVLAGSDCRIVAMHSLTIPADPKVCMPEDADLVAEVLAFAAQLREKLEKWQIAPQRVIFDPGIGFGKTAQQSLQLLQRVGELTACGFELLIGHSRKSFLTLMTNAPAAQRDEATLAVSAELAKQPVDWLRVHDVAGHAKLFAAMDAQ